MAAALRGKLRSSIEALAGIPSFFRANAQNVEVPGARQLRCSITCQAWLTDPAELDRLIALLAAIARA